MSGPRRRDMAEAETARRGPRGSSSRSPPTTDSGPRSRPRGGPRDVQSRSAQSWCRRSSGYESFLRDVAEHGQDAHVVSPRPAATPEGPGSRAARAQVRGAAVEVQALEIDEDQVDEPGRGGMVRDGDR